jgi:uncharacterized Zn-binding protein involved in type VI secretion
MGRLVVGGADLQCTMGSAPAKFAVVASDVVAAAASGNVDDFKPGANVAPFGMCKSMSNPQVASATSAAQGTLTPQPCSPVLTSAWSPGSSTVLVRGVPALHEGSECLCQWGGAIRVTSAGQSDVDVD